MLTLSWLQFDLGTVGCSCISVWIFSCGGFRGHICSWIVGGSGGGGGGVACGGGGRVGAHLSLDMKGGGDAAPDGHGDSF